MAEPSIGVDLGGTIEDSWAAKRTWFAVRGFDLGVWPRSRADIFKDIGGDDALYQNMVAEVYDEMNILAHNVVEGVQDALCKLAKRFRVNIVSSRSEEYRPITQEWLQRQGIAELVTEIALLGATDSKLRWCRNAGALALIDDDLRHLEALGSYSGITRIHFSPNPASSQRCDGNIVAANNWDEVVRLLARTNLDPFVARQQEQTR